MMPFSLTSVAELAPALHFSSQILAILFGMGMAALILLTRNHG